MKATRLLKGSSIGNEGVKAISEALKTNKSLTSLIMYCDERDTILKLKSWKSVSVL